MKKFLFIFSFIIMSQISFADIYQTSRVYGLVNQEWMLLSTDTICIKITDTQILINTVDEQIYTIIKSSEISVKEEGFTIYMKVKNQVNKKFIVNIDFIPNEELVLYVYSLENNDWAIAYVCNL